MHSSTHNAPKSKINCTSCQACCCRLEVMLISDTGVPAAHISVDEWGAETMLRLDDGWCSALNRENLLCSIYENRPWVCREFEMGFYDCIAIQPVNLVNVINTKLIY